MLIALGNSYVKNVFIFMEKKLQETYLTKTWKMLESLRSNVLNEVRAIPGLRYA